MAAYALDEDAAWRVTLGSSRVATRDGDDVLVPDFTRAMASDLEYMQLHPEEPEPSDFAPFLRRGTLEWEEFFSKRKVVDRVLDDGRVVSTVTSNKVEAFDGKVGVGFRPTLQPVRGKRFDVAALLTDYTLTAKFAVHGSFRAAMRNLAAVDTVKAAATLQKHVRTYDGYDRAEVVPGSYSSSWKAARETLKLHAARFPPVSVATDATFIGRKLFIYGEEGEDGWRVFGPDTVAALIRMVHSIVAATSPESVVFSLGPELTLLDIDVHDGEQVLCPARERHAGSHDDLPIVPVPRVLSFLSFDGRVRLDKFAQSCETLACDGVDSATAVRVSSKYLLVNTHVVNEGVQLTCKGKTVSPVHLVSRDLWLARCDGRDVVWPLRAPVAFEEVVLCYRRHGELQYGGPVRVEAAAGEVMTLSRDVCMQPGVSGAAVVALSDYALLGVYDGVSLQHGLAAVFSPAMYSEMCTYDDADEQSRSSASVEGGGIISSMRSRGFGKVVAAAMKSTVPLYSGVDHVGVGFSLGGRVHTTCNPNLSVLSVGASSAPLDFVDDGNGLYSAACVDLPAVPAVQRSPAFGDEVFVVGRDDEGYYCSSNFGRVSHVGVGGRVFTVVGLASGGLSLVGGLVIAKADAAVVGVYGVQVAGRSGSLQVLCRALPEVKPVSVAEERAETRLARIFPFLTPAVWSKGVLDAVLTHSSVARHDARSQAAYAMVGDSAMRTQCWLKLLHVGACTSTWQSVVQRLQSNAVQAARCEDLGLSALLRVGHGTHIMEGSKVHADLLEAVAGAVYMNEKPEVFEVFCRAVGALPRSSSESSSGSAGEMVRPVDLAALRRGSLESVV